MFHYDIGTKTNYFDRKAARAIIIRNNEILVIKSDNDEVKLPGGGLDVNESFVEALIREVKEETGFLVLGYQEFGVINTYFADSNNNDKIFSMNNVYYLVNVCSENKRIKTNYQGYEILEHFEPIFMNIDDAIRINEKAKIKNSQNDIAIRELICFNEIKKYMKKGFEK